MFIARSIIRACSDRSAEASIAALLNCLIFSSPPASRSKFSGNALIEHGPQKGSIPADASDSKGGPMAAFVHEGELFRSEEEVAQQYFFCYLSVRTLAAAEPEVLKTINATPLFWITTHHAMLLAAFVALGRIFDQDKKSVHNIDKLIKAVSDDLPGFTHPALAIRKQAGGLSAEDAAAYVQGTYELTPTDVRDIRKEVAHWRRVYEARYRDIRHGVFAHKGLDRAGTDALMA